MDAPRWFHSLRIDVAFLLADGLKPYLVTLALPYWFVLCFNGGDIDGYMLAVVMIVVNVAMLPLTIANGDYGNGWRIRGAIPVSRRHQVFGRYMFCGCFALLVGALLVAAALLKMLVDPRFLLGGALWVVPVGMGVLLALTALVVPISYLNLKPSIQSMIGAGSMLVFLGVALALQLVPQTVGLAKLMLAALTGHAGLWGPGLAVLAAGAVLAVASYAACVVLAERRRP